VKIGEFAKQNNISPKMLRHYDEIGLFSPGSIDTTNGYRVYLPEQSQKLFWILTLKNLGFSLDEVKNMMQGPMDSAHLIEALAEKRVLLAEQMRSVLIKSMQLDFLLDTIKQEGFQMNRKIDLSNITTERALDIKKNMPNTEVLLDNARRILNQAVDGTTFSFIRIDLRQFKAINDVDGYDVGDRVIISLYQIIEETLQQYGTSHNSVARAGGDEFVVFAEGQPATLEAIAHSIKKAVQGIDYASLGCHKPIDVYVGSVIAAKQHDVHLMNYYDMAIESLRTAHRQMLEGGEGFSVSRI